MNRSPEETVRALGLQSGFEDVGFAAAEPVDPETSDRFRNWLRNRYHASMSYMEQTAEKRLNPLQILPTANTVIVLLSNYYRDNPTGHLEAGRISRYAGGRDYHRVLDRRLKDFVKNLKERFPGEDAWYEVDTGPVLERYWAQRAGLGWVGKNTLLIHKRYGSWVFLSVVLTSLELTPSSSHPDHCGTCRACLSACPTQAFEGPGVLNSNLCLSYWTIEHRGPIPEEIQKNLNGWFFGCDDCQTVCPWNRHPEPTATVDYELRGYFRSPNLVEWARISREEWDRITRGTALRRPGLEGFRRNSSNLLRRVS